MTSASATTTPSTVATPAILATLALRLMIFISMRSVSPGTTGRRKRAFSMATSSTSLLSRSGMLLQHQDARGLRHGLDDQHAGHHRKIGEVAREKRLVGGDVLDPDDAFGFHFYDAVHQQKRVAMGQNRPDLVDVHNGHGSAYYRTATVCYRRKVRGRLPVLLLGAVTVLFLAGLFSGEIFDPDFWWHLKTGQFLVEQRRLPVPIRSRTLRRARSLDIRVKNRPAIST